MPQNRRVSTAPKQTKADRRAEARAAQLETFKRKQAAEKRNRLLLIGLSILGVLAVVAVVATVIVVNTQSKPDPALLDTVQTWDDLEQTHVEGTVDYPMTPPAGGPHFAGWLNCGVYTEPQVDEQVVHSLEHGAIWIAYDPELPESDVATLRDRMPGSYAVLAPYPGLDAPIAVSAWGAQLKFADPGDPAFEAFVSKYWRSADAPEPGAPCTGAIDGPGKE
jgi:hypothetical protein